MEYKDIFEVFKDIHPLIVFRTIEKLKKIDDIIYILNNIPKKYPIMWDDENKKWINKICHN